MPFGVCIRLSLIELETTSFLLVRVKASATSLSNTLTANESLYLPSGCFILYRALPPIFFVAQKYPCIKLGKINVAPKTIFGAIIEVSSILNYSRIHRVFKAVRETRLIEFFITMRRQLNKIIPSFFRYIRRITG